MQRPVCVVHRHENCHRRRRDRWSHHVSLYLKKILSPIDVQLEIVIYEKHHAAVTSARSKKEWPASGSVTVGGALGIAPKGLRVLRDPDEDLFKCVVAQGY